MSLLLDALKKAALEKQRRDQIGAVSESPLHTHLEPTVVAPHEIPLSLVRNSEQALESQNDLMLDPDLLDHENLLADSYLDATLRNPDPIEEQVIETTPHDEGFLLEIDDFELEETQSNLDMEDPSKSQTMEDLADLEPESTPPEKSATASVIDETPIKEIASPITATTHTDEATPKSEQPQQPITPAYTDAVGKSAFAQLLGKSQHAQKIEKRKKKFFFVALILTAGILVCLYYFYLINSNVTIPLPMRTPAEATNEEVGTENTEANQGSSDATSVTENPIANENETIDAAPLTDQNKSVDTTAALPSSVTTDVEKTKPVASPTPESSPNPGASPSSTIERRKKENTRTNKTVSTESEAKKLTRNNRAIERAPVDPNLLSDTVKEGYDAFQRGDIATADSAYQQALRLSPKNRDAILGAAAVAANQGRNNEALRLYQQQLQANPQDVHARAGLMNLVVNDRQNSKMETELNSMLRENPDAAYLYFMKGSLLARRKEWPDAQTAFFNAWQRDSSNPDYAFNLAVSLDHLGASKDALNYYRKALQLSSTRGANFVAANVATRIQTLEALQP